MDEISCLRELDHIQMDELIRRRQIWREVAQQRWNQGKQSHKSILRGRWREITEKTKQDLHTLAEVLISTNSQFKLVVSADQGYVYTNDLSLITQLDQLSILKYKFYTQATVNRPENTIRLKNPKNQYRSYFKSAKLTAQQKDQLMNFLHNQKDHVRISPSLQRWIDQPFHLLQDYFFVDYDSPQWLTMLALVCPNSIKKTMQIIPAK